MARIASDIDVPKIEGMAWFSNFKESQCPEKKERAKEMRIKEERKEDEDSLNINFFFVILLSWCNLKNMNK